MHAILIHSTSWRLPISGAYGADADILLFLNNDVEVRGSRDWLSKLVWHAAQPDVGVVGAKLLCPGWHNPARRLSRLGEAGAGPWNIFYARATQRTVDARDHTREMSVVTGACLAVRKSVFDRIGGFDPILQNRDGTTWSSVLNASPPDHGTSTSPIRCWCT